MGLQWRRSGLGVGSEAACKLNRREIKVNFEVKLQQSRRKGEVKSKLIRNKIDVTSKCDGSVADSKSKRRGKEFVMRGKDNRHEQFEVRSSKVIEGKPKTWTRNTSK